MTAIAGARITGEARLEMAAAVGRRYVAGEGIRAIAQDLGRSYGFVQQLLAESGVPPRARGGDTRSPAARARLEQGAQFPTEEQKPGKTKSADKKRDKKKVDKKKADKKKDKKKQSKQKAADKKARKKGKGASSGT